MVEIQGVHESVDFIQAVRHRIKTRSYMCVKNALRGSVNSIDETERSNSAVPKSYTRVAH